MIDMPPEILTAGQFVDAFDKARPPQPLTPPYKMDLGGGAFAYVMARGGRLIGVYPTGDLDAVNALWIDPDITTSLTKRNNWNLGGGRLWKGSEFGSDECGQVTFFCRTPGDYGTWECQDAVDPGHYERKPMPSIGDKAVYLESSGSVEEFKNGGSFPTVFTRLFDPTKTIKPPNRGVACANIDFIDSVKSSAPAFYAWNLVQIRAGDESAPGTVIYPCNKSPEIGVYMNEHGKGLGDLVKINGDHISIRTFKTDTRYKLSVTPESFRKTGDPKVMQQHSVMQVSRIPGQNDRYQLVVVNSRTCPTENKDIFEVSSVNEQALEGLGPEFTRKRGASYTYNGPTPAGGSWFTELEMGGKGARSRGTSSVVGSMSFYWGEGQAVMDAAKSIAGTKDYPFVFGLNE